MTRTAQSPEIVEHFFKELERPAKELTPWELDFLISVKDQFDRKGRLSEKQFEVLERIYAEKTE
jgi:hypothetical protein